MARQRGYGVTLRQDMITNIYIFSQLLSTTSAVKYLHWSRVWFENLKKKNEEEIVQKFCNLTSIYRHRVFHQSSKGVGKATCHEDPGLSP